MIDTITNDIDKLTTSLEERILSLRNSYGVWEGKLSSSALSTALAAFALWMYDAKTHHKTIENGLRWLMAHQNGDGGWGDTVKSSSNQSTTLLCWATLTIVKDRPEYSATIARAEVWLEVRFGSLDPIDLSKGILDHYQKDQTFSVPILAMCALSGRLGNRGWDYVPQLPFQLAILPDRFFKWLNLSVVSYAIPALIAIGLVKSVQSNSNAILSFVNRKIKPRVLRILAEKQPENGGFLEATPLTAFVLMSMVGAGEKDHAVCGKAVDFLVSSIRGDGSWPIDTNLSTWVTTLSINALRPEILDQLDKKALTFFLLDQQYRCEHPFTKSKPGGWAWTDLPGGVPDGDDTSGALLALKRLSNNDSESLKAAILGVEWLMGIQNKDGGIPTFCKGWGKLPFDCSCPDITAHALRAFLAWKGDMESNLQNRMDGAMAKAIAYLESMQREDGAWLPLWFGNERDDKHQNPVYGTSLVLCGLVDVNQNGILHLEERIEKGADFLEQVQHTDGSWGGNAGVEASVEETALAIRALSLCGRREAVEKGVAWMIRYFKDLGDQPFPEAPIGLYFASLWYFEEMYPLTFACVALNEARTYLHASNANGYIQGIQ